LQYTASHSEDLTVIDRWIDSEVISSVNHTNETRASGVPAEQLYHTNDTFILGLGLGLSSFSFETFEL